MSEVELNSLSVQGVNEVEAASSPKQLSAGEQLLSARKLAGLTIQQVADQLKLSNRQVQAIESNRFDELPKMVIVRGFIRSYAKLLKIDSASLISSLPNESGGLSGADADLRPTLATPFLESRMPFLGKPDNNRKYLIGAAVLAVAAVLFMFAQRLEQSGYLSKFLSPGAHQKIVTSDVITANSTVSPVVSNGVLPSAESTQSHAVSAVPASNADSVINETSRVAKPQEVDSPEHKMPVAENGVSNKLLFKFREDSWIQVKRDDGVILTSHVAKAGSEETFDVQGVLQVRIGNAAGVDGWLRGAAMEISPGRDTNVINLSVK